VEQHHFERSEKHHIAVLQDQPLAISASLCYNKAAANI
jgi:hypothetical protein